MDGKGISFGGIISGLSSSAVGADGNEDAGSAFCIEHDTIGVCCPPLVAINISNMRWF
jgi:hypothetical protein